jgi:hypothetical protein
LKKSFALLPAQSTDDKNDRLFTATGGQLVCSEGALCYELTRNLQKQAAPAREAAQIDGLAHQSGVGRGSRRSVCSSQLEGPGDKIELTN